jgi:hypothetical protein
MKIYYTPELEKVVKLGERFEVTDPNTQLGLRVFEGKVQLLGYDGACHEYNDRGFDYQKRYLTLELLEQFLQAYYDARKNNEPIPKG